MEKQIDTELLKSFGLNANDIKVYVALLSLGRVKTGEIIKKSGVASSRTYTSLLILQKLGLVSFLVKNNVKYYKAELPDQLIDDTEMKVNKLRELSKTIKELPIDKADRNETNTYEGIYGFKIAFNQHVEQMAKNESVAIIAFGNRAITKSNYSKLTDFFNKIDEKMFQKTHDVRILHDTDPETVKPLEKGRKYFKQYSARYLPSEYFSPTSVNLSKKEVMISIWAKDPIVFSIKNPIVVDSFWKNFEFLWNKAKDQ